MLMGSSKKVCRDVLARYSPTYSSKSNSEKISRVSD
jgi:hypothetical protein